MRTYEIIYNNCGNLYLLDTIMGESAAEALKKSGRANGKKILEEKELFGVQLDVAYVPKRKGKIIMAQPA